MMAEETTSWDSRRASRRRAISLGAALAALAGLPGVACGGGGVGPTAGAGPTPPAPAGTAGPAPPAQATAAWAAGPVLPATATDAAGRAVTVTSAERIVGVGGSVSETVYALGLGARVVATDTSSTYPQDVERLPRIGYLRTLAAEGVLALQPTVVLGTEEAGPPAAVEQLRGAGVSLLLVPDPPTLEAPARKIVVLAQALGVPARGQVLLADLEAELARARQLVATRTAGGKARPRVLFLYVRDGGTQTAAGSGTRPGAMIEAAGAINAGAEAGIAGYKPITAEAVVAAAPDVYLAFTHGLEDLGGVDALLQIPGLAQTPAGRARRVVHLDDLYLGGMGPRTGRALVELAEALHR
jgi:iron complex transport system substrate-binding protein